MNTDRCNPAKRTNSKFIERLVHERRMSQAVLMKLLNVQTQDTPTRKYMACTYDVTFQNSAINL